jgi:hypothetical protein
MSEKRMSAGKLEFRLVSVAQHPLMLASILIALATVAMGLATLPTSTVQRAPDYTQDLNDLAKQNDYLSAQINRIEKATARVAASTPDRDLSVIRQQLESLKIQINQTTEKQRRIENVILENPQRSLELPMIRRDIEEIRTSQKQDVVYLNQGIDRIYDFNKWLLGGMAVSVLLLGLDRFIGFRRVEPPKQGT